MATLVDTKMEKVMAIKLESEKVEIQDMKMGILQVKVMETRQDLWMEQAEVVKKAKILVINWVTVEDTRSVSLKETSKAMKLDLNQDSKMATSKAQTK